MMATTSPERTIRRIASITVGVVLLAVPACTSSDHGASRPTSTVAPTTAQPRPAGPAADLSTELSGGHGVIMGEAVSADLRRVGYVQHELLAAGTATSYKVAGALTGDGRWTFAPDASAPYRTRVLVRAPAKARAFSGTVIVEWLNVSGGVDANPEWASTQEEITRAGDAWVGVSAQRIGVEGGSWRCCGRTRLHTRWPRSTAAFRPVGRHRPYFSAHGRLRSVAVPPSLCTSTRTMVWASGPG